MQTYGIYWTCDGDSDRLEGGLALWQAQRRLEEISQVCGEPVSYSSDLPHGYVSEAGGVTYIDEEA